MADTSKTCVVTESGDIITPKGRISYPNLLTPNPKALTSDGKQKYTLSLLLPPDVDLSILRKAAGEAAKAEFGSDLAGLRSPFLDAYEKKAGEEFKGWTLLRMTSLQKPTVLGPDKKTRVEESSEIYPGRWAYVLVRPFAYRAQMNKGVSFGLQHVLLMDNDEPLAGSMVRAEDAFAGVSDAAVASAPAETGGKSADSIFG